MHASDLSASIRSSVCATILEAAGITEDMALIELTANPFAEAISCKVKTKSREARQALVRRYKAIVCGDEVYFGIPWNGAPPGPQQSSYASPACGA